MKRLLILLITIVMCMGLGITSSAKVPTTYDPLWTNILSMSNSIGFDGTEGSAYATVKGKTGTTEISGTLTIYRQSGSDWVYVTSTSSTTSSIRLSLGCDFSGVSGTYYKSVFEVTVTINGNDESETKSDYATWP